jgi:hypothetical protein
VKTPNRTVYIGNILFGTNLLSTPCSVSHALSHPQLTTRVVGIDATFVAIFGSSFFQPDFDVKNTWSMLINGTRWCISNFIEIEQRMSEKFEVSERGVVSEHGVRDSTFGSCIATAWK